MGSHNTFQFGVEIELLLGGRKRAHNSWNSIAQDLSSRLRKAGISNHLNTGNDKSRDNYLEWSISREITIPNQPAKNLWGIELVSPIYPIYSDWATDLSKIFAALTHAFTLHPSPHASTHVHISGTPSPLSPPELASLAKAVLYYEPALDLVVPASRRGSAAYWCQSNRANPGLKRCACLADCLAAVDRAAVGAASTGSVKPLVETMNLFPAASAYGKAHGITKDFVRGKVYKWDLSGMVAGGRGTIEFRQAPGSMTAEGAAAWVTLAIAFVAGAVGYGGGVTGSGVEEEGASDEELWALLSNAAAALGWESLGGVEELFARRG